MPSHHIRLTDDHAAAPLLDDVNAWLDDLRSRGEFGRLLAARGNLEAFLRSLAVRATAPCRADDLDQQAVVDFLCGHGPLTLYRGSWYFASDAGRLLALWARHVDRCRGTEQLALTVGAARVRAEPEMMRAMEAYEHLVWDHFGGARASATSRSAGWFRVTGKGEGYVEVVDVPGQAAAALPGPARVGVPGGAAQRLRADDLMWLDVAMDDGARPLAVGVVCCALAEPWLEARGWPGARTTALPPDVRARFTGTNGDPEARGGAAPVTPAGALEQ